MTVSAERQVEVISECLSGSVIGQILPQYATTKPRSHLHVAQRGHMQVRICAPHDLPHRLRLVGAEQILDERRGISDEDSQEAPRSARSSRMSSAAGRPSFTGFLASIRSKTSDAGGRATSRSSRSSMYSVNAWPRALARLVSSRWSRSGTFRTWIILDM